MKLIRHNQKEKAKRIFEQAKNIKAYTLENSFRGESCNLLNYKGENWLLKEWLTFDFARLTQEDNNKYELYIHSNCWYKFEI